MNDIQQLCQHYVEANRAANEAKRDILRQAIANGDDHMFSLNMRAVAQLGNEGIKRSKPRR